MPRNRFAGNSVDIIQISDGDWIEVLGELNTGDSRQLEQCGISTPIMLDGRPFYPIDWARYEIERAVVWIKRWSFHDAQGVQQPVNIDTIRALDTDTFEEINVALAAHVKGLAAKKQKRLRGQRTPTPQPQQPSSTERVAPAE